jgi:glycosyltransferase involved in cell wall biosynthesis
MSEVMLKGGAMSEITDDLSRRVRIGCVCVTDFEFPNQAVHQRLLTLARNYELTLFIRQDMVVPDDIGQRVSRVYRSPWHGQSRSFNFALFYISAFWWLMVQTLWGRFDAIYTFREYTTVLGLFARVLRRALWIADVYDDPLLELRNWENREKKSMVRIVALRIMGRLLRFCFRFPDLVIAVGINNSDMLPTMMVEEYGVRPDRILAVPNGTGLSYIYSQTVGQRASADTDHGFRLFYVGLVSRLRGMDTLLEATRQLIEKIPNLRVTLVGRIKAQEQVWLEKTILALGLSGVVEFLGMQPSSEVLRMVAQSDICLCPFPRRPELDLAYPIKVLEYLGAGRVVVASRLAAVSNIIHDGENGILCEPSDSSSLAQSVLRVYTDSELRERIERVARDSVADFDWELINQKVLSRLGHEFNRRDVKDTG